GPRKTLKIGDVRMPRSMMDDQGDVVTLEEPKQRLLSRLLEVPGPHGPDSARGPQTSSTLDFRHHRGPERQHELRGAAGEFLRKDSRHPDRRVSVELT